MHLEIQDLNYKIKQIPVLLIVEVELKRVCFKMNNNKIYPNDQHLNLVNI
jgi:hypothetical protein